MLVLREEGGEEEEGEEEGEGEGEEQVPYSPVLESKEYSMCEYRAS